VRTKQKLGEGAVPQAPSGYMPAIIVITEIWT